MPAQKVHDAPYNYRGYYDAEPEGLAHVRIFDRGSEPPILVAGKGAGTIKTGRHVVHPKNTPLNNLYLSLLDRVGVHAETLGDSTGKLQQLF